MAKKKSIAPAVKGSMGPLNFSGMAQEDIAVSLGLPSNATLREIRKAALEVSGLKGTRRSKNQMLTEAERAEKKEMAKLKAKERRENRIKELAEMGIPTPKQRVKLSEEERIERRKERGKERRETKKKMTSWVKQQKAEYEKMGMSIPDWMKKLK